MSNVGARTEKWDDKWKETDESGFHWHVDEPPAELFRLLDETELPPGGSLDVGCGDGMVTRTLAERRPPAVGLDIALPAVQQAQQQAQQRADQRPDQSRPGTSAVASFVVADAALLPFDGASFALVFDRGCMHNLPREAYPGYLREVARVLRPGGVFELFFAGRDAQRSVPGRSVLRQVRRKVGTMMGRGRPGRLTESMLAQVLPSSLETLSMAPSRFVSPKTGATVEFMHCVCRRVGT